MEELKSCPFCGEKDLCIEAGGTDYWVACNNCHALGPSGETEEDAAEAWNHRHEPPNPPLTLDELRQMDGEPVWVVEGKAKYYALITDIFPKAIWVTSRTDSDAEMPVDEYGKTWLAYRRRPEEEQK